MSQDFQRRIAAWPRLLIWRHLIWLPIAFVSILLTQAAAADDAKVASDAAPPAIALDDLKSRTFELAEAYFDQFQDPNTFVLYGARLSTKPGWTKPSEIKAGEPKPWGYGSRIADTALHCGHTLVALLDAHDAAPHPYLRRKAEELFTALQFIGSVCPVEGLVPRGPHPDDATAFYDDSSMDQHTTYIIALARYAGSDLATDDDKQWIAEKLSAIGRRLEKYNFSIKAADGVTQAHVGFSWKGFRNNHVSILIPTLYALYKGTGDQHWLAVHDQMLDERDGLRWQLLHSGDHVELNGHPIYANQNGFRLNAYLHWLEDADKKRVIRDLLNQSATMQLSRAFPGPFYRKFHEEQRWTALADKYGWGKPELSGAASAWALFRAEMLEERDGLPALAHVRFPLGGYHLLLMTEQDELIRPHLSSIIRMLTTVDLNKISAAETNYLFTVVALHVYALVHRQKDAPATEFGPSLENVFNVGIGPVMDVTADSSHAYAIGNRTLHVMDTRDPGKPRPLGKLSGLGRVRQIIVENQVAYIASREDGLFIVDVSDPVTPKLLSRYDTIEFATGVCKSGDVLLVACRSFGVELIDVSDPVSPEHISTVRTGEAQSVVARRGYLYAGVWASSEVVTVDIRNPYQPKIVSRTPLDGYGDGVDVHGDYLFAATGHHSRARPKAKPGDAGFGRGHGLEVLDLSNPASPKPVARVKFPALYNIRHDMWSVTVAGNHAFIADTHNGVFVLDVSDPRTPRFAGHWTLPMKKGASLAGFAGGLIPVTNHVYVAGGETDLHVLAAAGLARIPTSVDENPVTIPSAPAVESGQPFRAFRSKGQVCAVDFVGDQAIVACGTSGIHVLRIDPDFKKISSVRAADRVTDLCVANEHVFAAEGAAGLGIYQLQSGTLKEVARYAVPNNTIRQVEVPDGGRYALVQVGVHKIQIIDVGNLSAPKPVLEDQQLGLLYGDQLMRGLVDERYACAFWHVSGLHWYDLKADGGPQSTGDNFPGRIGSGNGLIALAGQTLATTRGGYLLLQRHERRPLSDLPVQRLGHRAHHLGKPTRAGNRLYCANRRTGRITIADITDPRRPKLVEQFQLAGNPSRVSVHHGVLIVPAGRRGLLVFDR